MPNYHLFIFAKYENNIYTINTILENVNERGMKKYLKENENIQFNLYSRTVWKIPNAHIHKILSYDVI